MGAFRHTLEIPGVPILSARDRTPPALRVLFPAPGALALRFLLNISCARVAFLRRLRSGYC